MAEPCVVASVLTHPVTLLSSFLASTEWSATAGVLLLSVLLSLLASSVPKGVRWGCTEIPASREAASCNMSCRHRLRFPAHKLHLRSARAASCLVNRLALQRTSIELRSDLHQRHSLLEPMQRGKDIVVAFLQVHTHHLAAISEAVRISQRL